MIIGVPKEIKDNEYRVALIPAGADGLCREGHQVLVQSHAGEGSGFTDEAYQQSGAQIIPDAAQIFREADMVLKVKEPLASEYKLLHKDLILFTYLHLAGLEELTRALMDSGVTAIAYETIELSDGSLPLLTPMSEVAGRMSVQVGAHYLEKAKGGLGKLMGGVPGVPPCHVVIIGGGVVGTNAAQVALGMGARVTVITRSADRLRYLSEVLHGNLETMVSNPANIANAVREADLLIGAVLVPGGKAPPMITGEMVKTMKPGSVVVDVSVDQGGCIETCRPTSHSDPIYVVDGVVHYCVANMPGAVPQTSTFALSNATYPYALKLSNLGFAQAVKSDLALAKGVNLYAGKVTCPGVAEAFGLDYTPLSQLL